MSLALSIRQPWSPVVLASSLVAIGVGAAALAYGLRGARPDHAPDSPEPKAEAEASAMPSTVVLDGGKLEAAGIRVEPARRVALPVQVEVAGLIEANPDRSVEIRPRVVGVVRSVAVQPSEAVRAGQVLATLDSAEVGSARLNLRARQLDLKIARSELEWKSEVAANIEALAAELDKKTASRILEKTFAGKPIGVHRAELLSAYADLEIAEHEEVRQTDLFRRQIVGEHPTFVAVHSREAAQAKFEAQLEQNRYDAALEKRLADQQVRRAEAAVIDGVKRLQILGVEEIPAQALAQAGSGTGNDPAPAADEDITAYPLVAPFDGTILDRSAVMSQRAEPSDVLFRLADLRTVRIVANVPESALGILPGLGGQPVRFTNAAYPGRSFEARVLYTDAAVDPRTRTVRLVAEAPNPEGLLRPAMFARITLAGREPDPSLAVPDSALVEFEGRTAVFVPGADDWTFTLRHVEAGPVAEGQRPIRSGLEAGDRVVVAGAFFLKSELILQNEPEED